MAGKIYITGDCHGNYVRFDTENFPEQKEMDKEDYVIVCGDFGYWSNSPEQKWWRKWLEEKPFTTLWVCGNHENYDMLAKLPVEEWNGGKVQFVSPSVIHLMRGQVFEIEGLTIFTFGGARSHDIEDGILEIDDPEFRYLQKELDKKGGLYRINHASWWKEEMPNATEFAEGLTKLEKHGYEVDYIISHCASSSVQALLSDGTYVPDELTAYFEDVREKCKYKKWFCGHYHQNRNVTAEDIVIYEQIIRIH